MTDHYWNFLRWRKGYQLTLPEAAQRAGVTPEMAHKLETGKHPWGSPEGFMYALALDLRWPTLDFEAGG